jgi:hypothetical protein
MLELRDGAPMIAGDIRHHIDFLGGEAADIAVLDKIVGVLVVLSSVDQIADVMQQGGKLEA